MYMYVCVRKNVRIIHHYSLFITNLQRNLKYNSGMVWILILNSDLRATRAGLRPTLVTRRSEFNIKIHTTPSLDIIYLL